MSTENLLGSTIGDDEFHPPVDEIASVVRPRADKILTVPYPAGGPLVREWKTNQFVYDPGANGVEAIVRKLESDSAILELTTDYRTVLGEVIGGHLGQKNLSAVFPGFTYGGGLGFLKA